MEKEKKEMEKEEGKEKKRKRNNGEGGGGGGGGEKEADPPLNRSQTRGSIPGPRDHDLSQRQTPDQPSHPGAPHPGYY